MPPHPAGLVVRAMGVAVGLPAYDPVTTARLRTQWERALTDKPACVHVEGDLPDPTDPVAHDFALTVAVTMAALRATAGRRLNLHAGAVADAEGRALAVVGASGAGKTTAIGVLARHLAYLSDETVSLSPDTLEVHPHPKPLSLLEQSAPVRRKRSVPPTEAGLAPTPETARLQRVVLLRRGDTAHGRGLRPVTTPEALVDIVPQSSSLVLLDQPLLTLARAIDRCGGAHALHYDEIADHVDELARLLAESLPQAPAPDHHPPPATPLPPTAGTWARTPWTDAVHYDDQLVVLVGSTAHLLDGLGTTLWLALDSPAPESALLAAAVAAHGDHPEAAALVARALAEMAERGLVSPDIR